MDTNRRVTPVAWAFAPEWLTLAQAAYLSGHSEEFLREVVDDGGIDARTDNVGVLLSRDELRGYQDSLALILHWHD